MQDPFGRSITYLRLSVTDRCDMRCVYCMAEDMEFLPRNDVLSLEEMERLAAAFIRKGITKLRLTGGEPLVRRNVMGLIRNLGSYLGQGGLQELTLTTNGSQLTKCAADLAQAGIRRINVSLDSLNPATFTAITRRGQLETVLDGILAARQAGLAVKVNMVAMKGVNDGEFNAMVEWCGRHGCDLCLIETMPLGEGIVGRVEHYMPLSDVRRQLAAAWTLTDSDFRTGGPARYVTVAETGGRIGFITPLSHNFCESCNRIRVTCTGTLYSCLGQEDAVDLRHPLRHGESDTALDAAIDHAITRKPQGHDFVAERLYQPHLSRHMSVTGG